MSTDSSRPTQQRQPAVTAFSLCIAGWVVIVKEIFGLEWVNNAVITRAMNMGVRGYIGAK